jgi:hypothetical protein
VSAAQSGTGQLEINQEHADVVHRIFKLYADGMSPRDRVALERGARPLPRLGPRAHGQAHEGLGDVCNRRQRA